MSYALNRDIRSFEAASAIGGYLIVAASGTAGAIAAAVAKKGFGVAERVGSEAGQMCDVTVAGMTEVIAGGDLDFDDPVTADDSGRAVKAVAVAGETVRIVGFIRAEGTTGDILPIQVAPSLLVTPA
ncbi:hypothetical protein E3C22_16625 [Jiella endophytica]|uniref:DUF2190 domain-containing protein n=1 Tax=Jiella endophytica TaxID=2558362 RepID=A0A4Y8RFP6_9HYPH|nr:hypothetical protein [Jiella endophytica]TFF20533.1 hypothetical protein E3C22_16625 [Jiella endophytica]